jgi:hypothetical protein
VTVRIPLPVPQVDSTSGLFDLMIFYDRDSQPVSPEGPTPVNNFATIAENLPEFAAACQDIRLSGCDEMVVDRMEPAP